MDALRQEICHYIVTHRDREDRIQEHIAGLFDVSQRFVSTIFEELDIPPSKKPVNYVG